MRQGESYSSGCHIPKAMALPSCGVQGQVSPSSEGELQGRAERAQNCTKSTNAEDCTHSNCSKWHHLHIPGRDDKASQILAGLFHLSHHSVSILNVSAHIAKQKHHQETPTGARRTASLMSSRLASVVSGDLFLREHSNNFLKNTFPRGF